MIGTKAKAVIQAVMQTVIQAMIIPEDGGDTGGGVGRCTDSHNDSAINDSVLDVLTATDCQQAVMLTTMPAVILIALGDPTEDEACDPAEVQARDPDA